MKHLSIIVPCYNEEEVLLQTYAELTMCLGKKKNYDYELIFVDDGSSDRTLEILHELNQKNSKCKIISLSRNFGHQIAVSAGLDHAVGDAVVLIDADLQDPPEVIWKFVEAWENGADVAYGVREHREGESWFKVWSASRFYKGLNKISDVPIPLDTGDFRLISSRVLNAIKAMPEKDRFLRGMFAWIGYRQVPIKYHRQPRKAGKTKYPLSKMIRFAVDGIISFSNAPLRLSIWMGIYTAILSLLGIVYAVVMRLLTDVWVPGWTLLFIAMLFLGGVQLLFLGVIGEYIGRIYAEAKHRPLYLVKDRLGFSDKAE